MLSQLIGRSSPQAALRRAIKLREEGRPADALPLFALAAKAGVAEAEFELAQCYLQGSGVPASRAECARWLERAAEHGHLEAQSLLAALCLQGLAHLTTDGRADRLFTSDEPGDPDFVAALKWARKAAEGGAADGQALLGYILTVGPEPMRNLEEAHRWYERSAAAGCAQGDLGYALSLAPRTTDEEGRRQVAHHLRRAADAGLATALYLVGVLTEQGVGVACDPPGAVQFYRQAAEKGHRPGQVRWGLALLEGRCVEQDLVVGETWLRHAALAGDPEAAALVGDIYAQHGTLPPNYSEAANWFRRAAEAGHQAAGRALASLYLTGSGVPKDSQEAARWLRISAEAGDSSAQIDFANLVLQGVGDPADRTKIGEWFVKAATAGDLTAAFNLGVCLTNGVGFARDEKLAALWLRYAAEGVVNAQYMYGQLLAEGRGIAPDLAEARAWIARASEAGLADAQVSLAEMMVNARGGPHDVATAVALFEKAAKQGHSGAMFALGALYGGGHNLPADRGAAQRWLRAAAEHGHGYAQMMLGRYLAVGAAGEPNSAEARAWLERAVGQGITEAQADLAALPPA